MRKLIAEIVYPEVFRELDRQKDFTRQYESDALEYKQLFETTLTQRDEAKATILALKEDMNTLQSQLDTQETPIEVFLGSLFKEVPKFAYKDKRAFDGIKYDVFPNEMIQPDKWMVLKAKQKIGSFPDDTKERAFKIGIWVDKNHEWFSDLVTTKMLDFYHSPAESLVTKEIDCDSHCWLVSSLDYQFIAVAFGYSGSSPHAWNVFEYQGKLWCLETNSTLNLPDGKNTKVFRYDTQSRYVIHEIFTKDKTYQVGDGKVKFGLIAR
jgi:hypothetical protein